MSNLSTIVKVQAPYQTSALINLSALIFGYPSTILIIFIAIHHKWARKGYQFTVLCMSICQLHALVFETLLYVLYLIALKFNWEMTLLQCSVIRRILQVSNVPANFSPLVLSIDRYIYLLHRHKLRNRTIILIFGCIFFYTYLIYVPLCILPFEIGSSDVCGPALVMPKRFAYFMQPIEPFVICLAFALNLRLLFFIINQNTPKTMESRGIKTRDFATIRLATFGLLIQVVVPFIFTLPQTVNFALYNLDRSFRFSNTFWQIINFFVYFELFLNSLVTLIFIKQFRQVVIRLIFPKTTVKTAVFVMNVKQPNPIKITRPYLSARLSIKPVTSPNSQALTIIRPCQTQRIKTPVI